MAVPFNLPEDQSEVGIIFHQFQSLFIRLQVAVRREREGQLYQQQQRQSQQNGASGTPFRRYRAGTTINNNHTNPTNAINPNVLPDLFNNLAWLAHVSQDVANPTQLSAAVPAAIRRSPRNRTSSESSCCEETKISITAIVTQDWNQTETTGTTTTTITSNSSNQPQPSSNFLSGAVEKVLSKLVPHTFVGSLWTAMICFVGWHLFQAAR